MAQSDVMCSASSRAKRTSLPKAASRPKDTSCSAQAEYIVPETKALLGVPAIEQVYKMNSNTAESDRTVAFGGAFIAFTSVFQPNGDFS